jgi:Ser/Thr protein kinase RdoA (MazF antagonist)
MLPIVHSVVDALALGGEIQRRFALAEPTHCELLTRGMNDVYLVRADRVRYAARVWRANKYSDDHVAYELAFLAHLKGAGVPVVAALPLADGSLYFAVQAAEGPRQVCLFPWAEGVPFTKVPTPAVAHKIGATMARIHDAAETFQPPAPRPIDFSKNIERNFPAVAARLAHRPRDVDFLRTAGEAIISALDAAYTRGVPCGPIHGDIHARNVFVAPDGTIAVLDFDTCGDAHLGHDLTSFTWASRFISLDPSIAGLDDAISDRFLEGYDSVRALSATERADLPLFTAVKEFSFICGMSAIMNLVGHMALTESRLDWLIASVRRNAKAAGLA